MTAASIVVAVEPGEQAGMVPSAGHPGPLYGTQPALGDSHSVAELIQGSDVLRMLSMLHLQRPSILEKGVEELIVVAHSSTVPGCPLPHFQVAWPHLAQITIGSAGPV